VAGTFKQTSPNVFETDITASTTQTQGNGQLTANLNEVSTVANTDDTVTLPVAEEGRVVIVMNNGANTLQIFPTSGADIQTAGVNISIKLPANESIQFMGFSDLEWHIVSTSETLHAEVHEEFNTDAYVVNATDEAQLYHTAGLVSGDLLGWTFRGGGAGTSFPIASIADAGGGQITVTTTGAHGLAVGDMISQTGLSDSAYVGIFEVDTVPTTTTYTVTAVFTATGTGTMDAGFCLIAAPSSIGTYIISWQATLSSASNNQTFNFGVHNVETHVEGSRSARKFSTGGDIGSVSGVSIATIATGSKIVFIMAENREINSISQQELEAIAWQKSELENAIQNDLRMIRQEFARRAAFNGQSGKPVAGNEEKQKAKK